MLLRSGAVMPGYRNDPEKTAEAIDSEGWLHTGDVGEIDADGYLTIVDRKKELIINSAGKNMSPANIESKLKAASPLIGQVCADRRRPPLQRRPAHPRPRLRPRLRPAARDRGPLAGEPRGRAGDPGEVEAAVERGNAGLSRVEQVKKFKLLRADWQPGGDELTPTMKLKRRPIAAQVRGRDRGVVRVVKSRARRGSDPVLEDWIGLT